jgi:hypothetical protein
LVWCDSVLHEGVHKEGRKSLSLEAKDHQALVLWAADCAEHVLDHFERVVPGGDRPRRAVEAGRAWTRGALSMPEARAAAFAAHAAAREVESDAARAAARAAGHAAATAHVPGHARHAAAYAAASAGYASAMGGADQQERDWQLEHLPAHLRQVALPAQG